MGTYQVENFEIENKQLKHAHNNFCVEIMNSKRQENWRNLVTRYNIAVVVWRKRGFKECYIPANFFWDVGVRFLSEGEVIEKTPIHKIRDREEGIVIYSFYTWFSFVTWVWVNIFLEIVSSKTTTTHIFNQAWEIGPQAWAGVRSKFSTRRRESWQV